MNVWERLYRELDKIIESLQPPPIYALGERKPSGQFTPTSLVSAIIPAVGGTIIDYPTIMLATSTPEKFSEKKEDREEDYSVAGFTVRLESDKILVSEGTITWRGEKKVVPPTQLPKPKLPTGWFVVVNLRSGEVGITVNPSPLEKILFRG